MTVVVLEPHPDDAVLFACWAIIQHTAHVVTVCGESHLQHGLGVTSNDRVHDTEGALFELDVTGEMWPIRDDTPDWEAAESMMRELDDRMSPTLVFAPASERNGNPAHTTVGLLADKVFGDRVTFYLTYTGAPSVKSRGGGKVVPEQAWIPMKLRALACYESQFRVRSGAYRHFMNDLEEYRQ